MQYRLAFFAFQRHWTLGVLPRASLFLLLTHCILIQPIIDGDNGKRTRNIVVLIVRVCVI